MLVSITDVMIQYIKENNLTDSYLIKIGIPKNVVLNLPFTRNGIQFKITLSDFLKEMEEEMNSFLKDELYFKDNYKTFKQIKLSTLLKEFQLPVCPFWLEFCNLIKIEYIEQLHYS